ncbi:pantoate--beta-alanine ligase [Aegicerativicinus sediminis]|uniref:pantoate--beta-alanine ligase n=1 Tax=Aegicerativicinus sediminis TaxID=2893202 RepID=UPI001E472B55|nr:pantoate--beta-alanine ligase [Aegicerativicinus sediminis]
MKIYTTKKEIAPIIEGLRKKQLTIGLVPTMGALHQGHISLVKTALEETDQVIASIFVNPTQFNNQDDLDKYPRPFEQDIQMLKRISENIIVYAPTPEDIYDGTVKSENYEFDGLENPMEGKFRKGHFDGVGSIVRRLFETLKPSVAYFGEKDYQQLLVIKKLVEKLRIPVEIKGCPILRESDGLAMSSRNGRLSKIDRDAAPFIFKTLNTAKKMFGIKSATKVMEWVTKQFAAHPLLKLEYFQIADSATLEPINRKSKTKTYRAFIAVYAGDVRLIDNIALN